MPALSPSLGQGQFFDQQHVAVLRVGVVAFVLPPRLWLCRERLPASRDADDDGGQLGPDHDHLLQRHQEAQALECGNPDRRHPGGEDRGCDQPCAFEVNKEFDVVYAKPSMPGPPTVIGDFSPYVQAVLSSDKGEAPDLVVLSVGSTSGFGMRKALVDAGYTGDIWLAFYDPRIAGVLKDSLIITPFAPFESEAPAMKQLIEDVRAFDPDVTLALSVEAGYLAADMFIEALKKTGKNLTPESLQKATSTITYKLPGVQCPTTYPESSDWKQQTGGTGLVKSNGTTFDIVVPYAPVDTSAKILPLKGHPATV